MNHYCVKPSNFISFLLLLLTASLTFIPSAQADSIKSITFKVPLNVTNIHPDIQFIAPMCRIFTGQITNNANQLGAVRPDISVDANRSVRKKLTVTLTSRDLSPGKNLNNATLYTCVLYIKTDANGPLLSYSTTSNKKSTKAVGEGLVNDVRGQITAGRSAAISINTGQLSATGTFSPSASNGVGVRKPGSPVVRNGVGVRRPGAPVVQNGNGVRRPGAPVVRNGDGVRKPSAPVVPLGDGIRKPGAASGGQTRGGVHRSGARRATPDVRAAVGAPLGPEPVVTSWSPQEITYPGQTLVIEGRDFRPGFVIQLQGAENRSINLQITKRTPTRIEAKITTFDYTGHDGAALVVSQQGGKKKTLVQDYKVVNENASFRGDSLWRQSTHLGDTIFTRGEVNLTLNKLEFSDSGIGTLREEVDLPIVVRSFTESCDLGSLGQGTQEVREWDFRTQDFQYPVQWSKLADGRILIDGIGQGGQRTAIGQVSGSNFGLQYNDAATKVGPSSDRAECQNIRSTVVEFGAATGALFAGQGADYIEYTNRPLRAAPLRLVEWSLERVGP